jgi:hypothetical protein
MLDKIEQMISEVETQLKSQTDFINDSAKNLEQLTSNRQNAMNNIFLLNGALQAYKSVQKILMDEANISPEINVNEVANAS